MLWKSLAACLVVLLLTSFCWMEGEKTYRVPRLHGEDIYVKESQLDKLTPLGWAMMLDIVNDKASRDAYERQCQKDPELAEKVNKLFETKAMIDAAKRKQDARRRLFR